MDYQSLFNIPAGVMESHLLRTQTHQLNFMRTLASLIPNPAVETAWMKMMKNLHESISAVNADVISGGGPVGRALRQLVHAGELDADEVAVKLKTRLPTLRSIPDEAARDEPNWALRGAFHSHINCQLGVNQARDWNWIELGKLYDQGLVTPHTSAPRDASCLFFFPDESYPEGRRYGVNLYVEGHNRNLITVIEGDEEPFSMIWVDLERTWVQHLDLRLVPEDEVIEAAVQALFDSLGLTADFLPIEDVLDEEEANDAPPDAEEDVDPDDDLPSDTENEARTDEQP